MAKKSFSAGFKSSFNVSSDGDGHDGHSMHNEILVGLPKKECEAVFSNLEFVEMRLHDVLNEMGEPIKYCYFVNSGLASILNVMSDGKSVEVGLTGKEGFVGLPLIAGFRTSPNRINTQAEGMAFRVDAEALREILQQCPELALHLGRARRGLHFVPPLRVAGDVVGPVPDAHRRALRHVPRAGRVLRRRVRQPREGQRTHG